MKSVIVFLKNIWNAQELAGCEEFWRIRALGLNERVGNLEDENAALRKQVNQRGSDGKFTKKSPS